MGGESEVRECRGGVVSCVENKGGEGSMLGECRVEEIIRRGEKMGKKYVGY